MPSGLTNCVVQAQEVGSSGEFGMELNDSVWDVKMLCDEEELQILFGMINVCIEPADRVAERKHVFHDNGNGFQPLPLVSGRSGYVCGKTNRLSLFTLGLVGE